MNIILLFVLIGLAVGLLASVLRDAGGYGFLGDVSVGGLGALIGGFLIRFVNGGDAGLWGSMAAAALGAALLVLDLRLLRRSFAEQLIRRVIGSQRSYRFKRCPCAESPPETNGSICRVCGQKHPR